MTGRYQAVLFDAFGTLFELDRPFERLRAAVRARLGADRPAAAVEEALRAEVDHYAAHCQRASDAVRLHELQVECAAIVVGRLALDAEPEQALAALADTIVYRTYDDVEPALAELGRRGIATAVVSNWDYALPEVLDALGLRFPVVVTSAEAGASKPDPAPFRLALERLGIDAGRALHVGDTPVADGDGARSAGLDVRIVHRGPAPPPGSLAALTAIPALL